MKAEYADYMSFGASFSVIFGTHVDLGRSLAAIRKNAACPAKKSVMIDYECGQTKCE